MALRYALEKAIKTKINLTGANLTGANLRRADLSAANLTGANLTGAYLTGANLMGANLTGANLTVANLMGANLMGADLNAADLMNAYLMGADLTGANLTVANLTGADLMGANLMGDNGEKLPRATPAQAIENLDKVRAIVMDNKARLDMGHWHENTDWIDKTCAEEVLCGTTHCMAGWLQVCTTETALKTIETQLAGILAAPAAAKMFYTGDSEAYEWLESRAYVEESKEFLYDTV